MRKLSLGLHIGHNRGASIVDNDILVGHIAQEKLDRIKYSQSSKIPYESVDALLSYLNLKISDINAVGISYENTEAQLLERELKNDFIFKYGLKSIDFFSFPHHFTHAIGSYYTSGFNEALILVADGAGDLFDGMLEAESLFIAQDNEVELVERRLQDLDIDIWDKSFLYNASIMPEIYANKTISLGRKYEQFTYYLNFGNDQNGKTMGLASYGTPLYDVREFIVDGLDYNLKLCHVLDRIDQIKESLGKSHMQFLLDHRADVAATVQVFFEHVLIHILKGIRNRYGGRKLCLGGGVFLNCVANHKIVKERYFEDIYLFPPNGDEGHAIGAAIAAYRKAFGAASHQVPKFPYIGLSYSQDAIRKAIEQFDLTVNHLSEQNLISEMTRLLTSGKTIGLLRGRSEAGPRALCHRSILADPRDPGMKDKLNKNVKFREAFRPYAPVVTAEDQFRFFNLAKESPFMLLACDVHPQYREKLPAITHVDGTARVQAIEKDTESFIHGLLKSFESQTGFPILLNTSFNLAGEPIVEHPVDAIRTFLSSGLDVLVLENYICIKDQQVVHRQ